MVAATNGPSILVVCSQARPPTGPARTCACVAARLRASLCARYAIILSISRPRSSADFALAATGIPRTGVEDQQRSAVAPVRQRGDQQQLDDAGFGQRQMATWCGAGPAHLDEGARRLLTQRLLTGGGETDDLLSDGRPRGPPDREGWIHGDSTSLTRSGKSSPAGDAGSTLHNRPSALGLKDPNTSLGSARVS